MWPFSVEPDQVLHEDHVELRRLQERMGMVVHELFLNRPVEALAVGVHFRRFRIRVVVREVEFRQPLREVLLEFRAVVREHIYSKGTKHHLTESEEFFCGLRGVGRRRPGKGEPAVEIFEGDDDVPAGCHG